MRKKKTACPKLHSRQTVKGNGDPGCLLCHPSHVCLVVTFPPIPVPVVDYCLQTF